MTKMLVTLLIGLSGAAHPAHPVPDVLCAHPPRLELIRFEDGSARLECGHRLLVRVVVPW